MPEPAFTPGEWEMERSDGYLINGVIHIPDCYQEHKADAHLIAAAPDLYEALQQIARMPETISEPPMTYRDAALHMVEIARKALAKARGEA